jgi:tRNA (guanine37-N1)-methyltransferase
MAIIKIDVITLFPNMLSNFLEESILGRAARSGILEFKVHNLRAWGIGPHTSTDDRPFGGGAGMVLKPEPLFEAVAALSSPESKVIYFCPDGEPFTNAMAPKYATAKHLILISGHYDGIDQRVRDAIVRHEISIGDYVLTNGTLPAAVFIDAVCRHVPGVLGDEKSLTHDSFQDNLLGFPQYTRPASYQGMDVPEVLLSGNHGTIADWRKQQQLLKTKERRPDLLK